MHFKDYSLKTVEYVLLNKIKLHMQSRYKICVYFLSICESKYKGSFSFLYFKIIFSSFDIIYGENLFYIIHYCNTLFKVRNILEISIDQKKLNRMKSDSFYNFFAELFVSEEKIKTNFRKHIIFLFRQKKKKSADLLTRIYKINHVRFSFCVFM